MKTASSLQEYYESKLAKYRKIVNQIKVDVEAIRAERSSILSPTVAKGDRDVKFDREYIRAAKKQATAQYIADMTAAQVNMLGRIYFDSKLTYEKGNKNYREGREWS
jgi:hypothetical protein